MGMAQLIVPHTHTHTHTLQVLHYLLKTCELQHFLSDLQCLAMIFSAIVHDLGHNGRTNVFLRAVKDARCTSPRQKNTKRIKKGSPPKKERGCTSCTPLQSVTLISHFVVANSATRYKDMSHSHSMSNENINKQAGQPDTTTCRCMRRAT